MDLFNVYPLFPIQPIKAEGSWLWDAAGKKYLDLYGGHAVISIGHNHPVWAEALRAQLGQISFYSNSVQNPLQEKLAARLGEVSGYPDFQLFLCNSGAEANENALKLASFVTGRSKILAFKDAFHGRTSAAVAATDNPKIVAPLNAGHQVSFLPLNDLPALEATLDDSYAAVIIEGIQGVGGIRLPEDAFLQRLSALCKAKGVLLILDEVQSGYGRTGRFFAHQYAGIRPDLITVAKGMGNGFPIGGVLISPDIQPRMGMLGTTFGGNYLACAAALAVLEVIETEKLMQNALEQGQWLTEKLQKLAVFSEVRGRGLMLGFEPVTAPQDLRQKLLHEQHIFTGEAKPNTIRLLPSLAVSRTELDYFMAAVQQQIQLQSA